MALELTETTQVLDLTRALRRALLRLRQAGYRVLLDDIVFGMTGRGCMACPSPAFKLDRSLVEGLPCDAQARQEVRRLVRRPKPATGR